MFYFASPIPSLFKTEESYDDILFISPQIYNYYFQTRKTKSNTLGNLSFKELLQYIENEQISDFHIEAQDFIRYQYSARLFGGKSAKSVVLEKNIRKDQIEELIHQAKLMMHKDTLEQPPVLSGLVKAELTNIKGRTIERTFRINIMVASKPPHRTYSVVIRRLKNLEEIQTLGLEGLGYIPKAIDLIRQITKKEYGINVVAGATNSGKTTLLTTILEDLRKEGNRILSIENPIEIITHYVQFDLSQYESADEKHKLTQRKAMKGFLRHDPDIVLFSEIRDEEIPDFVELGLRGHVAYATIHAGKVTDVILRLIQATENPIDVINSLNGIIVQSLYPKKCKSCKGKGCKECKYTGQSGVVPIYEIAYFKNIEVSELITEKGMVDFKRFFDFTTLVKKGQMEYISMKEVAEKLYKEGSLFEKDYRKIVELSESIVKTGDEDKKKPESKETNNEKGV